MVGMGWPGRRPGRGQARGHGGVSIGDPPRLGQPDREIQGSQQSSLEGRVRSEPVSEIGLFRAILDGNKLVLAPKIAKNRNPGA